MASGGLPSIGEYDFSFARQLALGERFQRVVARFQEEYEAKEPRADPPFLPIPATGFEPKELLQFELNVDHLLPHEYRQFLRSWRYLAPGPGLTIWGQTASGEPVGERPYIFTDHRSEREYLVFAEYWHFGEGDHLMMETGQDQNQVYLSPHSRPEERIFYAPTFSLALCRLAGV